MRFRVVFL
uniref:Uncharacterized protein n=1 Tax=Oryza nivara TaxID=4536 RepID=A0A0G2KBP5_ORYNI